MRKPELIKKRNIDLEKYYKMLIRYYPHWKHSYIIQKVGKKFYLTERAVETILFNNKKQSNETKTND